MKVSITDCFLLEYENFPKSWSDYICQLDVMLVWAKAEQSTTTVPSLKSGKGKSLFAGFSLRNAYPDYKSICWPPSKALFPETDKTWSFLSAELISSIWKGNNFACVYHRPGLWRKSFKMNSKLRWVSLELFWSRVSSWWVQEYSKTIIRTTETKEVPEASTEVNSTDLWALQRSALIHFNTLCQSLINTHIFIWALHKNKLMTGKCIGY